jgi:hypothetical protein
VLAEVCQILAVETDDCDELLKIVRKIERVVQAVPRMEGFISNLCREMTMSEDRVAQLPLEQMVPRV